MPRDIGRACKFLIKPKTKVAPRFLSNVNILMQSHNEENVQWILLRRNKLHSKKTPAF